LLRRLCQAAGAAYGLQHAVQINQHGPSDRLCLSWCTPNTCELITQVRAGLGSCVEATMSSEDLVLDRKVRDWVVVPLTLCILLMMLLRQYVSKVRDLQSLQLQSACDPSSQSDDHTCCRCWQVLLLANNLLIQRSCERSRRSLALSLCATMRGTYLHLLYSRDVTSSAPR